MDVVWIVLGVAVLALTLLDVFLAVLNYDEGGLFVDKFVRFQWLGMRAVTRRVGRRWRPLLLRQVTGIMLVTTIFWWLTGIILGFTLIYFGSLGFGVFQITPGVNADFLGAFYLSVGQFATVGVDNINPGVPVMNLLTVSEAMVSIVLLSFIITFLGSVYGVVASLRSLCGNFFSIGQGVGDPIDTLAPFFPDGQSRGLDGQLGAIVDSLTAYSDGLAQNRASYYFQSGRDQFSLPFAINMTSGVIGALVWGLPTGSDPAKEPNLARLTQAYEEFRLRLLQLLNLPGAGVPTPVSAAEFGAAVEAFDHQGSDAVVDPWVLRFLAIDRRMAGLTRSTSPIDRDDAYQRYTRWLPFEVPARAFAAAVARDLDYQPVFRQVATTPDGVPLDTGDAGWSAAAVVSALPAPPPRRRGGLEAWFRRRHLFIDPGFVRLADAVRALAAVVVAVGLAIPLAGWAGAPVAPAAVFAGMISVFSAPSVALGRAPVKWWTGALAAVPAVIGALLGVLLPHEQTWSILELAAVAALCAWLRRFGPRVGGMGMLVFVTYYMSLLLGLGLSDLVSVLIAVAVGVVATWAVTLLPGPSAARQIEGGIDAFYARVSRLIEVTTDLVSTGRRDRRLVRALRSAHTATQQTSAAVSGYLDAEVAGISAVRARALRVRIFDLQLAATSLITLLPVTSSITITAEQRARLAADLLAVQRVLESFRPGREDDAPPLPAPAGPAWPVPARRILSRIVELRAAVDRLREAQLGEVEADDDAITEQATGPEAAAAPPPPAAGEAAARSGDRQAVQAGISTGIALLLGSLVSTTHQYWAAMPAFQVLSGSDGETRVKGMQRVLATILASGFAFGLAIAANHSPYVAIPLLAVSTFAMAFMRAASSPWMSFWQTMLMATMYDVMGRLSVEAVEVRLAETAIGALVAVAVSALVLPTRTRARVLQGMSDIVRKQAALAGAAFSRLLGADSPSRADLNHTGREIGRALSGLETVARPMRKDPGSLQSSGIEAQLTCLWATLAYEEQLARIADLPGTGGGTPWRKLSAATADNFDAVQATLEGSLPQRVHGQAEFDVDLGEGSGRDDQAALLQTKRLNQTLLALIDAVSPGTVDSMTSPDAHPADPGDTGGGADQTGDPALTPDDAPDATAARAGPVGSS